MPPRSVGRASTPEKWLPAVLLQRFVIALHCKKALLATSAYAGV